MKQNALKTVLLTNVLILNLTAAELGGGGGGGSAFDVDDDNMSVMSSFTTETTSTFASMALERGIWSTLLPSFNRDLCSLEKLCKEFEKLVLQNKRNVVALKCLTNATDDGSKVAENLLGHVYLKSSHFKDQTRGEQLIENSLDFLIKEAGEHGGDTGDKGAQLCLGLCHLWGHGTDVDVEEAQKWLKPLESSEIFLGQTFLMDIIRGGAAKLEEVPEEVVRPYLIGTNNINQTNWSNPPSTPLTRAASKGDLRACVGLIQRGADVTQDNRGFTALRAAAVNGHIEVCRLLLDHGANNSEEALNSCFLSAASANQKDVCALLLERGANVNYSRSDKGVSVGFTALVNAAGKSGTRALCELLLESGADVNQKWNGETPLEIAVGTRDLDLVKLLVAHGATITEKALRGSSLDIGAFLQEILSRQEYK